MLYLTKEIINDTNVLSNLITTEKNYINSIIQIQNTQKETIYNYVQKFGNDNEYITQEHIEEIKVFLNNLKKYLNVSDDNFVLLNDMKKDIDTLQSTPYSVDIESFNSKYCNTFSLRFCYIFITKNIIY